MQAQGSSARPAVKTASGVLTQTTLGRAVVGRRYWKRFGSEEPMYIGRLASKTRHGAFWWNARFEVGDGHDVCFGAGDQLVLLEAKVRGGSSRSEGAAFVLAAEAGSKRRSGIRLLTVEPSPEERRSHASSLLRADEEEVGMDEPRLDAEARWLAERGQPFAGEGPTSRYGIRYVVVAVGDVGEPPEDADLATAERVIQATGFKPVVLSEEASDALTIALLREQRVYSEREER